MDRSSGAASCRMDINEEQKKISYIWEGEEWQKDFERMKVDFRERFEVLSGKNSWDFEFMKRCQKQRLGFSKRFTPHRKGFKKGQPKESDHTDGRIASDSEQMSA